MWCIFFLLGIGLCIYLMNEIVFCELINELFLLSSWNSQETSDIFKNFFLILYLWWMYVQDLLFTVKIIKRSTWRRQEICYSQLESMQIIMVIEFTVTWKNCLVHTSQQYRHFQSCQYSWCDLNNAQIIYANNSFSNIFISDIIWFYSTIVNFSSKTWKLSQIWGEKFFFKIK